MEKFRLKRFGRQTKLTFKWSVRLSVILAVGLVLTILVMLGLATGNTEALTKQFNILVLLNGVLIIILLFGVVTLGYRLLRQLRGKQFGAKLTTRFAVVFAVMAIVPGMLIYLLSIQYMTRSIESWFNVKVDSALSSGLTLGQASLDSLVGDLNLRARQIANELNDASEQRIAEKLTRLREANPMISDALVFSTMAGQRVIGFSSSSFGSLLPQMPSSSIINQLRLSRQYNQVEMVSEQDPSNSQYRIRTIVPVFSRGYQNSSSLNARPDPYWLQVTRFVPENIGSNLNEVQQGFRDYEELALSRSGLKELFIFTLSLALLFTVLASIVVALWLARRMVQPLLSLAEGTQAVAVGDYRPLPEPRVKDEIAQLTRSFNVMTRQLDEARRLVESNRVELERSNVFLENILTSLTAGVIVFDENFNVSSINKGAEKILHQDLSGVQGKPLDSVQGLDSFAEKIRQAFAGHSAVESQKAYWQEQIELELGEQVLESLDTEGVCALLLRGARLVVDGDFAGYLVVFDDVSDVIAANRAVAWAEVARRLAHEIKNPLTPIQLSAERLAMKLASKVEDNDAEFLKKSTNTIVNQVTSLKKMVDDFREYARTPPAQMEPINLNELLTDLAVLYGWDPYRPYNNEPIYQRLALNLDPHLPLMSADPVQIRQVMNNLLSNARDAMDALELDGDKVGVTITTKAIRNDEGGIEAIRLTIKDRGPGFSPKVLQSAFEPYVTTKNHGTGLGLAIVRKIVDDHGGKIDIANNETEGARISILFRHLINTDEKPSGLV